MEIKEKENIKVLITAGSTKEPIDAVRHISNFATGRLGVEIAKEAFNRGYDVHLLYGSGKAKVPDYIPTTRFTKTGSLLEKVLERIRDYDVYVSSAAVSDYSPVFQDKKISSAKNELNIKLKPTPKVLKEARKASNPQTIFVAFKLGYNLSESELIKKAVSDYGNLSDIIIANDLTKIEKNKHESIFLENGRIIDRTSTKQEIASKLFNYFERDKVRLQDEEINLYGRLRTFYESNERRILEVLNKNKSKSKRIFEQVFSNKIISDIEYLLDKDLINTSEETNFNGSGFFRNHINLSGKYEPDLRKIISRDNIDIGYFNNKHKIYSTFGENPKFIDSNFKVRGFPYFKFDIKTNKEGEYFIKQNNLYINGKNVSLNINIIN